jgi:hypothetical protein
MIEKFNSKNASASALTFREKARFYYQSKLNVFVTKWQIFFTPRRLRGSMSSMSLRMVQFRNHSIRISLFSSEKIFFSNQPG